MTRGLGAAGGRTSRRKLLRVAGSGAALAVLGAGAAGCRQDDQPKGGGKEPSSAASSGSGSGSGSGGSDGRAPKPLWSKPSATQINSQDGGLLATAGVVLAAGEPLTARDAKTGAERWSLAEGTTAGARLLLGGGTLFLASGKFDGSIGGLDPATGKETWRSRLGPDFDQPRPIAADDKQVYVTAAILKKGLMTRTNVIAALNARTGKLVWREKRDTGTEENGINAVVQGNRLVYTDIRKNLTVRDTATGRQVWTHKTGKTNYGSFAVHQDLVIVAQGASLQAFRLSDGGRKWSVKAKDFDTFKAPSVLDGILYVADSGRNLWAMDPSNGRTHWRRDDLANANRTAPIQFVKVKDTLYGGTELDDRGGVHAFDVKTGALRWTFNDNSGDFHEWLVATDGTHVFAHHGKKLHALPA
ncbi:PQQ-binding-like beta-propeller repeat protein [Streptomyces sp. NPDC058045]|uniref:PQQ-binding-like beta-propeller repeat protein n=1 Tax=Streptomyces sp. NPDC058045 TaxID=3346311 RepID=UPI0036E93CA7